MRLKREDSALLVIDIQRKLAPHIAGHHEIIRRADALMRAAALFGVPRLLTEHCPNQIGAVIEPLRSQFEPGEIFEKTAFSATDHPEFVERVRATGRRQVVMTGMEAHVCVLQAALGLRQFGFQVFVVADAIGSRGVRQFDRELALRRMEQAGCGLATTETVLFEWTGYGTDAGFRDVLTLVKSL
ncbi:MAG: hydrolase [Gemmatimonadota bacterium]